MNWDGKMTHITYHVLTDKHDQYLDSLEAAKDITTDWKNAGESNIKIYKITAEEVEPDVILLDEKPVQLNSM